MFKQEIDLKSDVFEAFGILGIRIRLVAFSCLRREPEVKNSVTAEVTSPPTTDQQLVKNSEEYPSGPLALLRGREKKADQISSTVKGNSREAC